MELSPSVSSKIITELFSSGIGSLQIQIPF